jgi:glycine betaine transporter
MNWAMVVVGIIFVINSFDSLIRLYTDNMNLSVERVGKAKYLLGNIIVLSVLTVAFQSQWLKIEWVGSVVIALYVGCLVYIVTKFRNEVMSINSMPNA